MTDNIKEKITLFINNFIKEYSIPGLAIGVVYKNQIAYSKGFGTMNIETGEPITPNTFFPIASLSKTFVATGIMQLVEKGLLKLDDTIIKYLPYFKFKSDSYETLTIRELLTHTTGLPDLAESELNSIQYIDNSFEEYINSFSNSESLMNKRGIVCYNDLNFDILGHLISKISGMPFESYIKENILKPINMNDSTFLFKEVNKSLVATPHHLCSNKEGQLETSDFIPYTQKHAPSSGLCSNIVEMFNWILVNLNKGKLNGIEILKEESYLELFKPQAKHIWGDYTTNIGLSWFIGDYKDNKLITHGGHLPDFRSNILLIPEKEIGLILMTNSDFKRLDDILGDLLDIILGY